MISRILGGIGGIIRAIKDTLGPCPECDSLRRRYEPDGIDGNVFYGKYSQFCKGCGHEFGEKVYPSWLYPSSEDWYI